LAPINDVSISVFWCDDLLICKMRCR
jgi:hypothetical protein